MHNCFACAFFPGRFLSKFWDPWNRICVVHIRNYEFTLPLGGAAAWQLHSYAACVWARVRLTMLMLADIELLNEFDDHTFSTTEKMWAFIMRLCVDVTAGWQVLILRFFLHIFLVSRANPTESLTANASTATTIKCHVTRELSKCALTHLLVFPSQRRAQTFPDHLMPSQMTCK